ncbi:divergent polysaccharide deacetylase family protein [uncultured Ferrovibrio sp.]|uniref:divergent polysaccharide deacetylase family protein n=1 Tax=uncultured Ferrovibrio sp. TaxID=1576913 RepID=UPI00262BAEAA|nr:divergent polysaccharide deacetylase family protein [uncultured Ferrovibrio sp.]
MAAATALLAGGIVMGMAVGSSSPTPAVAVAAVAPLPQAAPQPPQNSIQQNPVQQSAALAAAVPAAPEADQGWRPVTPATLQPMLAPVPAPAPAPAPVMTAPAMAPEPEPVPAEKVEAKSEPPSPPPLEAAKPAAPVEPVQAAPVQLAAAPVAPPSLEAATSGKSAPAWRARAVAPPAGAKPPFVAIIIDDAGLDRKNTARAIKMAGPLTISFMSYAHELAEQSAAARAAGHEVMLHLPMEPLDAKRNNPGPNALWLNLDEAELKRRLQWNLDRFDSYVGINNHMGSRFTADAPRMTLVMEEVSRRQIFWLDSLSGPKSVGSAIARKAGVDTAERDLFLDDERSPGIQHELAAMERIARARGDVIAIGHPHTSTLDALEKWIAGAKEKGFSLVPVSTVLLRRQQQER